MANEAAKVIEAELKERKDEDYILSFDDLERAASKKMSNLTRGVTRP